MTNIIHKYKYVIGENKWLIGLTLIGVIIRGVVCEIYDKKMIAYISKIDNNNLVVLLCIFLLILLIYGCCAYDIIKERTVVRKRNYYQLCFCLLAFYYCQGYELPEYQGLPYIYGGMFLVCIIELILLVFRLYKRNGQNIEEKEVVEFTYDVPSKNDIFQREHYARTLIDKIIATDKKISDNDRLTGSFTVLLNEEYGYGKTSFLVNFQEIIAKDYSDCIRVLEFAPWLCESEDTMVSEFFALLKENLSFVDNSAGDSIDKYCKSILQSKSEFSMLFSCFLNDNIRNNSEALKDVLRKHNKPIIIIIDDVDRLKSSETLAVLKLLRSTANLPHLFYIVAADKEFICSQLLKENIIEPYEYLRKFINLELQLPANNGVMANIIQSSIIALYERYDIERLEKQNADVSHDSKSDALNYILNDKILVSAFKNPRDWHSYHNLVTFSMDILVQEKLLGDIYVPDLLVLLLLEFINPKVYKILRDKDDMLLELTNMSMKRVALKKELIDHEQNLNDKEILLLLERIKAENNNSPKPEKEKVNSLGDYYKENAISKEHIAARALYILFGDKTNYRYSKRICFVDNYFMYFSGRKREQEITNAEAVSLFMSHEPFDYKEKFRYYANRGCIESIIHKIHYLIDDHNIKGDDRVEFVKRFFDFWEILGEFGGLEQTIKEKHQDDVYDKYKFQHVFFKLYYSENGAELGIEEQEKLKNFFTSDKRYIMILNFIKSFKNRAYQSTVINYQTCSNFYNIVRNDIINGHLRKDPFSDTSTLLMKCMKEAIHTDWGQEINDIIVGDALPWLYSMVKFYDECCVWRYNFKDAIIGKFEAERNRILSVIYSKIKDSKDIIDDFESIRLLETLIHEKTEDHIFLQKAKIWWEEYDV